MSVRLDWILDPLTTSVKIYHNLTQFTSSTKPSQPLATLPSTATSYIHMSPASGVNNFYMIEFVKQNLSTFTPCIKKLYYSNFGYGKKEVLRETPRCSILDVIPAYEFCPASDLVNLMGGTSVLTHPSNSTIVNDLVYLKVSFNGKLLYIPTSGYFTSTWAKLYSAGLLMRSDTTPNIPTGTGFPTSAAAQNKRITIGNYTYRVGMPSAFVDRSQLSRTAAEYTAISNRMEVGSELDMIRTLFGNLGGIARDQTTYTFGINLDYLNSFQLYGTNNQLVRYAVTQYSSVGSINRASLVNTSTSGWIPILELE